MSWVKQKESVDLDQFQNIDEDSLVEALSPEELADLNAAIDPEVRIYIKERHDVPPVIQVIIQSCQVVSRSRSLLLASKHVMCSICFVCFCNSPSDTSLF